MSCSFLDNFSKANLILTTFKGHGTDLRSKCFKEVIKTFKNFSAEKDPANNCLDTAIITDPKLRTKKTIKKLEHVAGRVLKK